MSMGQDFVSDLRPPAGLLFIPEVIYEYGESLWNNDVDRGKLICPLELSGNIYQQSRLVAKQEKHGEEMLDFTYEVSLSYS
jgi:hypothetical protein